MAIFSLSPLALPLWSTPLPHLLVAMPADQLALPETMRAWVYRKSGRPEEVLYLESDRPLPVHEGYPILVKVKAVALNPEAYKVMAEFPGALLASC
jgi:hypothetical protein